MKLKILAEVEVFWLSNFPQCGYLVPMGDREFRPVRCKHFDNQNAYVAEQEDSKLYTLCITESYANTDI